MKEIKHKVLYRKTEELNLLEENPRTISDEEMQRLKTSIKDNPDYFEARPIILSNRTGKLVVLAGNQRLLAARSLGMEEVPSVLLEGLTEEREREIIIRDNVNNGEWDYQKLIDNWDMASLNKWGVKNIKKSIDDEKDIEQEPPKIVSSFVTFEYADEITLFIQEETAQNLMEDMIKYKEENGSYDGFWDKRLKK